MRMRLTLLTVSLLGALTLPCRAALAQASGSPIEGGRVEELAALTSPSLEAGWWRSITDALDAMRGLRGHRIPPLVAGQVDLSTLSAPTELLTYWQELPHVAPTPPRRLELRFGRVYGMPIRVEPVTASVADLRDESDELLGAWVTFPWLVP